MRYANTPLLLASTLLLATAAGWAQSPGQPEAAAATSTNARAGVVKRVAGNAVLERTGQPALALAVGQVLQVGDTVRTGADGMAGITLSDDTLLAAGPNSQLVIAAFGFDTTTQDGNMVLQLWRGALNVVTGLIARRAPEKVQVQTRTVVLGVRGTDFIVQTDGGQP